MAFRKPFALLVSQLAIALFVSGCSHRRHHDPEKRSSWMLKMVADELDLNDDQTEKLEAVRQEMLGVRKEMHANRKQHMDTMLEQVTAPTIDQAKLQAIVEEHTAAVEQATPRVLAKLADFHASLTPEQKEKAAARIRKFRRWHED